MLWDEYRPEIIVTLVLIVVLKKKKILTTTTRKWESEGEGNVGTVIREMLQYK
jgi:hypothetical protein